MSLLKFYHKVAELATFEFKVALCEKKIYIKLCKKLKLIESN